MGALQPHKYTELCMPTDEQPTPTTAVCSHIKHTFCQENVETCCLGITIGFITAGSSQLEKPDKYQQLPQKASILQLNH